MPGPDSIIVLESYYEPMAAHVARTRLEAAGIPCFLTNENLVSLNRLYSHIAGGVRLHVRLGDAEAAATILRDESARMAVAPSEAQMAEAQAAGRVLCPNCGSDDVAYGPALRNTYSFWQSLLSVVLAYPLRGKRQHCFHCGHEFD
jgi:hypothetical protein